jgi:hypothetical protein
MQYLLLIYESESRWQGLSQAQQDAESREFGAYSKEFAKAILGSNALQPTGTAKTVRVRDGQRQTVDGPFAETKEQLGGYYLVDVSSEAEAIAMAARIPWARTGSIEVRPILKFS